VQAAEPTTTIRPREKPTYRVFLFFQLFPPRRGAPPHLSVYSPPPVYRCPNIPSIPLSRPSLSPRFPRPPYLRLPDKGYGLYRYARKTSTERVLRPRPEPLNRIIYRPRFPKAKIDATPQRRCRTIRFATGSRANASPHAVRPKAKSPRNLEKN